MQPIKQFDSFIFLTSRVHCLLSQLCKAVAAAVLPFSKVCGIPGGEWSGEERWCLWSHSAWGLDFSYSPLLSSLADP